VGELFFLTTALPGLNLYGCPSANTWLVEAGDGGGLTTIQNTGVPVGARAILDLTTGTGILQAISDNGIAIALQTSADTAVVQTLSSEQSGARLKCSSSEASGSAYLCSMSPLLTTYTQGMVLHFIPDVDGTGGAATLDVDSLGPVAIKLADGVTDPAAGELIGNRLYQIWHDGSVFRLVNHEIPPGALAETRPACAIGVRGRVWFVAGGAGVQDTLAVCAKDATDAYAWRTLY
jgi:hypothetical protein